MILSREYNSNTIEIWNINIENTDSINYLIIVDKKRKSTVEDYPWLSEEEKDFFESRDNYINVQFISNSNLEELNISYEDISEITENLLGHVAQAFCNWNIDFTFNANSEDLLESILKKYELDKKDSSNYKFLSQD